MTAPRRLLETFRRENMDMTRQRSLRIGSLGRKGRAGQKQLAMAAIREHEVGMGIRLNCVSQGLWQPWRRRRKPELCFWCLLALWPQLGEELGPRASD